VQAAQIIAEREWVYWLDMNDSKPVMEGDNPVFRVCIVVAGENGFHPTGCGGKKEPWYWDEEFCAETNCRRGYTPEDMMRVVGSSLMAKS